MSKIYHWRLLSLMVLVLMIFSLSAVAAQDSLDEQPLLKMLAHVPDNATSRSVIIFNDRKAIEVAFPPAKMPADWVAFAAYRDDDGKSESFKPVDVWWRVWRGQQSSLMNSMHFSDSMEPAIGFDFFAVAQELNYGMPPSQALQLSGQFDLGKVRTALTIQGYIQQDQTGIEVWCGPDGCDSGSKLSLKDRNRANPFGGDLGRKWPIVVQEGSLMGSPDLALIQNHVAVNNGNGASLGAAPEYRAAVDALTQKGVLMQSYFWDGKVLKSFSELDSVLLGTPLEQRKAIIVDILKDYEPLPIFKLLVFADAADESKQIGEVALVYSSADDAKKAAEILPKRIAAYKSLVTSRLFSTMLTDRGVTQPDIQVIDSNGEYVVLVSFAVPKPTIEDILAMGPIEEGSSKGIDPPGTIFRLLIGQAMRRDLGWLSTVSREDLEAAMK